MPVRVSRGLAVAAALFAFVALSATAMAQGPPNPPPDPPGNELVEICHVRGPNQPPITILVDEAAVPGHLGHGDTQGACQTGPTDGNGPTDGVGPTDINGPTDTTGPTDINGVPSVEEVGTETAAATAAATPPQGGGPSALALTGLSAGALALLGGLLGLTGYALRRRFGAQE